MRRILGLALHEWLHSTILQNLPCDGTLGFGQVTSLRIPRTCRGSTMSACDTPAPPHQQSRCTHFFVKDSFCVRSSAMNPLHAARNLDAPFSFEPPAAPWVLPLARGTWGLLCGWLPCSCVWEARRSSIRVDDELLSAPCCHDRRSVGLTTTCQLAVVATATATQPHSRYT